MEPVKPKTQKIVEHIPEDIGNNTPTDGFQTNGSEERTCSSRGGSINNSKSLEWKLFLPGYILWIEDCINTGLYSNQKFRLINVILLLVYQVSKVIYRLY